MKVYIVKSDYSIDGVFTTLEAAMIMAREIAKDCDYLDESDPEWSLIIEGAACDMVEEWEVQ